MSFFNKKSFRIGLSVAGLLLAFSYITVHAGALSPPGGQLGCQGTGYCSGSNPVFYSTCSASWTLSDTNSSYLWTAYRGVYRDWNDVGINVGTVNGVTYLDERSNADWNDPTHPGGTAYDVGHPSCTCGDGACGNSRWDNPVVFFDRTIYGSGFVSNLTATTFAEERKNSDPNSFKGFLADTYWGGSEIVCSPGERNQNANCVPVTGSLSTNPATCSAPCNLNLSWTSNAVSWTRIYQNGIPLSIAGGGSPSGGGVVGGLGVGTYTFTLSGDDGFGTEVPLGSAQTITVTPGSSGPPSASMTASGGGYSNSSNLTVPVGTPVTINWSHANADQMSANLTMSQASDPCGNTNGSNASGLFADTPNPGSRTDTLLACQSGISYTFTYTARDSATGQQSQATVTLNVTGAAPTNGQCATPPNGGTYATFPGGTLCASGNPTPLSGGANGPWSWSCVGIGTGATTAPCSANGTVSGPPTATMTASGGGYVNSHNISVPVGTLVTYNWSHSNADQTSAVLSMSQAFDTCGNTNGSDASGVFPFNPNPGVLSGTLQPCQSGISYTYTYTARNTATGQSAQDVVTVNVTNAVSGCTSNAQCDDSNACTSDSCNISTGLCSHNVSGTHNTCGSGNSCTSVPNTAAACSSACATNADCGSISVQAICPAQVSVNQSVVCTSNVTGASNPAVTWSVVGAPTYGTIGLYDGTFYAPGTPNLTAQVIAQSVQDPSKSSNAYIQIIPASFSVSNVVVTCPPGVLINQTGQCTVVVNGTRIFDHSVIWSLVSGNGSVNGSGLYQAPGAPTTAVVQAVSVADPSKSNTGTISVTAPSGCSTAADCTGGSSCTNAVCTAGVCSYPVIAGSHNTCQGASCVSVPNSSASCASSCTSNVECGASTITSVSVSCTSPATVNQTVSCSASVIGTGAYNPAVTWSVTGGGSISAAGNYTAPGAPTTATVTAKSVQDISKSGTDTIQVVGSGSLTASLSISQAAGPAPLVESITATAYSNDLVDTFNYSFWWDCSYAGNDVAGATAACGDPNNASIGQKFSGVLATSELVGHTYSNGSHIPKVIIEQGAFTPATDSKPLSATTASTVTSVVISCPVQIYVNQTGQCTATVNGSGVFDHSVTWSLVSGGGGINSTGLYSAPSTPTVATVKVASVQDSTKTQTTTITVLVVPACAVDADCSTGNVCTTERCVSGSCIGTVNPGVHSQCVGTSCTSVPNTSLACVTSCASDVQCGGSSIGNVTVTCTPKVNVGQKGSCSATVTGTGAYNPAVTWSVTGGGSIDAAGNYTAPGAPTTATVTAKSVQDVSKSGTDTIQVVGAGVLTASLGISQSNGVAPLSEVLFATAGTTDLVDALNYSFWWDCSYAGNDVAGATAACGDPNNASIGQKFNGVAALAESVGHIYASANTYNPKVIIEQGALTPSTDSKSVLVSSASTITSIVVNCNPTSVSVNGAASCTATVNGTGAYDNSVIWTVSGGTITSGGLFTAPSSPAGVTVKATSVQDPSKNGTSAISVTAASTLSASLNANPSSGNAPLGVTLTANAGTSDLVDTFNYSVWWDCTYAGNDVAGATAICGDPNIATIGQKFNGIAAPSEIIGHSYNAGTHHPKVIIEQGAFAPATAGTTVTVTNASGITAVSVVCNPLSISIGGTSTCTPTVIGTGAYNPAVTWSVTGGGTISATGVYTGPAAPTNATVKATSVQDPTKNGTAPVVVTPPPPVCTFSAAPTTIIIPQQSTLSWSCQNAVTCSISPTVGSVSPVAGSTKVSPSAQTTYTLTCNGVGSTSLTQSVIVKVSGPGVHETNP